MNKKIVKPFIILILISVVVLASILITRSVMRSPLPKYSLKNQTISFESYSIHELEQDGKNIISYIISQGLAKEDQLFRLYTTRSSLLDKYLTENKVYVISYFVNFLTEDYIKIAVIDNEMSAINDNGDNRNVAQWAKKVIESEHVAVDNPQTALDIAGLYVELVVTHPEDPITFLDQWEDIPIKTDEHGEIVHFPFFSVINPKKYKRIIKAPRVLFNNNGYFATFFTWEELGGIIKKWEISISPNGTIDPKQNFIANRVGTYTWCYDGCQNKPEMNDQNS